MICGYTGPFQANGSWPLRVRRRSVHYPGYVQVLDKRPVDAGAPLRTNGICPGQSVEWRDARITPAKARLQDRLASI